MVCLLGLRAARGLPPGAVSRGGKVERAVLEKQTKELAKNRSFLFLKKKKKIKIEYFILPKTSINLPLEFLNFKFLLGTMSGSANFF